jgi:methionine synthase I (cobalamin-dependent)
MAKVAIKILRRYWDGPITIYPNSGTHDRIRWQFDTVCTPEEFVDRASRWLDAGVNIVGGCCGIGPDHIRALAEARFRTKPRHHHEIYLGKRTIRFDLHSEN